MNPKTKRKAPGGSNDKSAAEKRVRKLVADGFIGGVGEVLAVEQTRTLWTKTTGSTTIIHELFGKYCGSSKVLEVCGIGAVGSDGSVELRLSDFVCLLQPNTGASFERFAPPAFVVATPRSDAPVYLTSRVTVQTDDVLIRVFAWNPSGTPSPGGLFDWHCCVRLVEPVG